MNTHYKAINDGFALAENSTKRAINNQAYMREQASQATINFMEMCSCILNKVAFADGVTYKIYTKCTNKNTEDCEFGDAASLSKTNPSHLLDKQLVFKITTVKECEATDSTNDLWHAYKNTIAGIDNTISLRVFPKDGSFVLCSPDKFEILRLAKFDRVTLDETSDIFYGTHEIKGSFDEKNQLAILQSLVATMARNNWIKPIRQKDCQPKECGKNECTL